LLRHRMHTTNIYQKVTRSHFRRLFKIGHLCTYFLLFFENATPPWRRGKAIHTKQFQNGTLAERRASVHRMATPARIVGRLSPVTRPEFDSRNFFRAWSLFR
jgi:hypothetical protein